MGKHAWLFIWLVGFVAPVFAQEKDDFSYVSQVPLFFTEINPESPVGIFTLDTPFNFLGDDKPGVQLSLGYSMGNTWHPKAWFLYPQDLTLSQKTEVRDLYMGWRPDYFDLMGIKTEEKSFQSDGVLQHFRLTWLKNWKSRHSLVLNMNLHMLTGGKSPINFLASDGFIEAFHTNFAVDDNFGRRLYQFDRAAIEFVDENGNRLRKEKEDVFLGVFDAHYYRDLFHLAKRKWQFDSQVAAHVSLPFNRLHRYIVPGVSTAFRTDYWLGPRSSVTFALDGGVTDQTFLKTGEGVHAIDWKYRKQLKSYIGVNFTSKKNNTFLLGILNNYQDPLLKGYYFTWDQTGYEEIGVKFLEEGDVWEGEPVSQEFWLAKLTPASLYYFSIKSYLVLGFHKKGHEFTCYIGEDMISINNAPDIQFGFQYRLPLIGKK